MMKCNLFLLPTLNYSITCVHLKGTTFSESKHFTFSLKKIAAIMPDIKPRCSKSSNHSDPNSAEAPTCIPTFNTKHMHQNVAEQQVTKDKLHFKGECKCFAELKHKYIKETAGVEY